MKKKKLKTGLLTSISILVLPHLKSAPSNLSNGKVMRKNKKTLIMGQKCLIWVSLG